ncbi:hypothetical protein LXL04_032899 [Taraxacum kok-saghyz]
MRRRRYRNGCVEENRRRSKHKGRNDETVERGSRRGDGELVRCVIFQGYKLCTGINRRRRWPPPPPADCSSPSFVDRLRLEVVGKSGIGMRCEITAKMMRNLGKHGVTSGNRY